MRPRTRLAVLAMALAPPLLVLVILLAQPVYPLNGEARFDNLGFVGLTPGSVVDQPLTASHDDLSVVSVPFATSIGTSAARVRVTLADASGQVLVDRTLDAKDLTDLGYKDISFAPIPHSAGMTFHVGLKTPSAITGQPLSVVTAPATTGTPPLTMNGQVGTVALPVHTFYGSLLPAWRALPVLMERVSQYKPGILKLPWLAIWLVAALAATGAWAWTLARSESP